LNFAIITFGCKVNQYQGELLRETLLSFGLDETHPNQAQIVFLNGCLVTDTAKAEALRVAKKLQRDKRVIVTGCTGVSNDFTDFERIHPENLEKLQDIFKTSLNIPKTIKTFSKHTRAMVMIQLGCSNYCSYCIVPYLRGEPKDRLKDEIIKEITDLVEYGHKEVVLCGTELGHFKDLPGLLEDLTTISKLMRIRLSSINARHLTPDLVQKILSIPKIAPHLHLPLQSGSDKVLDLMNRGYDSSHFLSLVNAARLVNPNVAVTTDIIVGFPGETDKDFGKTVSVMQEARFSRCHIFPFSPRPGTNAAKLTPVNHAILKQRVDLSHKIAATLARECFLGMIGKNVQVLVETGSQGLSGSYMRVRVTPITINGEFVTCKVFSFDEKILIGERIEE